MATNRRIARTTIAIAASAAALIVMAAAPRAQERPTGQGFSFKTATDLINVATTVTDGNGRFVNNLKREDFEVYEDGQKQEISQFDSERVPVSLGIALDTSGSMLGEKIVAAQAALNRFLFDLLGPQDEVFLYRFDGRPELVQGWTQDRQALSRAIAGIKPNGGTAIYDTVEQAIPLAAHGQNKKKALVIISDGNDTSSHALMSEVQQQIRQSEVLVYAVGIDASDNADYSSRSNKNSGSSSSSPAPSTPSGPRPQPSPFPGAKTPPPTTYTPAPAPPPPPSRSSSSSRRSNSSIDRVNPDALHALTDDSGGRTEIIVSPRDLDPATAGIADELSRQYFIGYVSTLPKDGKWHSIEVRIKRGNYIVRARKGYFAS